MSDKFHHISYILVYIDIPTIVRQLKHVEIVCLCMHEHLRSPSLTSNIGLSHDWESPMHNLQLDFSNHRGNVSIATFIDPSLPKWRLFSGHVYMYIMKSTKVQTLGELCMRDTANWWAGLLVCVYSCLPLVARGESDTGCYSSRYHAGVDTRPSLWLLVPSRYRERVNPLEECLFQLAYWFFRLCFML